MMLARPGILKIDEWASRLVRQLEDKLREYDAKLQELTAGVTYDPGNLADAAGATTTVAVPGAELGDFVQAAFSLDLQGVMLFAWVSAAEVVSVRFQNESGSGVDLAEGTLQVKVRKP
jgi:hypothetical protein